MAWWRFQWPGPMSGLSYFKAEDRAAARKQADAELARYGDPPGGGTIHPSTYAEAMGYR
jgi:hypothetical protein